MSSCDENCCCDSDCPDNLRSLWSSNPSLYCKDYRGPSINALQPCSSLGSHLRGSYWKPFSDALIWATCIYIDNSPRRFGLYMTENFIVDADKVARLKESTMNFTAVTQQYWKVQSAGRAFYQPGDYIAAQASSGLIAPMPFPSVEPNGRCNFDRPLTLTMQDSSVTCNVPIEKSYCRGPLNTGRIASLSLAATPELKSFKNISVTYFDYSTKVAKNPQQLSYTCSSGDVVVSVLFYFDIT